MAEDLERDAVLLEQRRRMRRIERELQRTERLLKPIEWLHRFGNIALIVASIALFVTTCELLSEPTPSAAVALVVELLAIETHLILHLVSYFLRTAIEQNLAEIECELDTIYDEGVPPSPAFPPVFR